MPMQFTTRALRPLERGAKSLYWTLVERFARNDLLTYASAIAFQTLVALVPLALLAFVVIGYAGADSMWEDHLEQPFQERLSYPNFFALSSTAEQVIESHRLLWLVMAAALTVWEWSGAVRATMGALNRIFAIDERRRTWRRFAVSFLLAVPAACSILLAVTVVALGDPLFADSLPGLLSGVVRWVVAVASLWFASALLFRYAPGARPVGHTVTLGSILVIAAWIVATLTFGWYVSHVANFRSAFGAVTSFIVLTGYLYTSAIILLVGAQLDQLAREKEQREGLGGILEHLAA